jgi:hypothetical protein
MTIDIMFSTAVMINGNKMWNESDDSLSGDVAMMTVTKENNNEEISPVVKVTLDRYGMLSYFAYKAQIITWQQMVKCINIIHSSTLLTSC